MLTAGEGAVCSRAQSACPEAAEFWVCVWFSLYTAVCLLRVWCDLPGGLGYRGRGPKQTQSKEISPSVLEPLCCSASCSIWPGQKSGYHILPTTVRGKRERIWGCHSSLPVLAQGLQEGYWCVGMLGSCAPEVLECCIHIEDFLVVFMLSSTSRAAMAYSASSSSVGEWLV